MHSIEIWNSFYKHLGYLFYSVAACDKKVTAAEIEKLHDLVKEDWTTVEDSKDEFGSDAAFQIEIVFDWLTEQMPPATEAFEDFSEFIQSNPHFLTGELKKRILITADSIASAFSNKNKSELTMLFQLEKILK